METPSVTIVIPQRDGTALTRAAIRSLRQTDATRWPVIVIDDGSDPPVSLADFAGLPEVRVQRHNASGLTAAWNAAVAASTSDLVVLLNNDVVATGPWVERLIAPLLSSTSDCRVAGVAWRDERRFPTRPGGWPTGRLLVGWVLAFSRRTWLDVGGFREELRLYWSDTDFQLRVVEQFGQDSLQAVSSLPLRHLGHATTRRLADRRLQWQRDRGTFARLWSNGSAPVSEHV